ncbi:hypothetical protein AVEN_259204-1 [Araneus ventricosus]|uniref:Transposase Tc1-like domain-containing protein n=1 Tax=Araneus ventricosus TaxID=182803 RepID=A0A4Y2GL66_ARAVE|nr:hypothetical protein AVEN_259204-1 [Araneus ventricosus]
MQKQRAMCHFKAIIAERVIRGCGKDVKKGQIIAQHQGKKSCMEIAEVTSIGFCTVQFIIKSWKDVMNQHIREKKCGGKTILNNRDGRSLKRLIKSNRQKSTLELKNSFDKGSKTISTRAIRRELKGMGLKSCSAAKEVSSYCD